MGLSVHSSSLGSFARHGVRQVNLGSLDSFWRALAEVGSIRALPDGRRGHASSLGSFWRVVGVDGFIRARPGCRRVNSCSLVSFVHLGGIRGIKARFWGRRAHSATLRGRWVHYGEPLPCKVSL